jgi:hypothetical protein
MRQDAQEAQRSAISAHAAPRVSSCARMQRRIALSPSLARLLAARPDPSSYAGGSALRLLAWCVKAEWLLEAMKLSCQEVDLVCPFVVRVIDPTD